MTALDINTPRGQQTLADEQIAIRLFEDRFPGSSYIQTPKDGISIIDGVIEKGGVVTGIVETKCRYDMTLSQFERERDSAWLVTFEKIDGGRRLADLLQVQLWGFLYFVKDSVLLAKRIYDPKTGWQVTFRVTKSETQATVNGGRANRDNAYIDMRCAMRLTPTGEAS